MKFRKVRLMTAALCFALIAALGLAGCGSSSTEEDSSAEEEQEDEEDEEGSISLILTLDDETEIGLIALDEDEAYIYGKYICESDGAVWAFGGYYLAVSFYDEDGELDSDIYSMGFYEADESSDASDYLYVVLTDLIEGTSVCWAAANVTDDDGEVTGVALINPSDESYYLYLVPYEEDEDETEDEE